MRPLSSKHMLTHEPCSPRGTEYRSSALKPGKSESDSAGVALDLPAMPGWPWNTEPQGGSPYFATECAGVHFESSKSAFCQPFAALGAARQEVSDTTSNFDLPTPLI